MFFTHLRGKRVSKLFFVDQFRNVFFWNRHTHMFFIGLLYNNAQVSAVSSFLIAFSLSWSFLLCSKFTFRFTAFSWRKHRSSFTFSSVHSPKNFPIGWSIWHFWNSSIIYQTYDKQKELVSRTKHIKLISFERFALSKCSHVACLQRLTKARDWHT
jgi:hypothetical protein